MTFGEGLDACAVLESRCNSVPVRDLIPRAYRWEPFRSQAPTIGIFVRGVLVGPGFYDPIDVTLQEGAMNHESALHQLVRTRIEIAVLCIRDRYLSPVPPID